MALANQRALLCLLFSLTAISLPEPIYRLNKLCANSAMKRHIRSLRSKRRNPEPPKLLPKPPTAVAAARGERGEGRSWGLHAARELAATWLSLDFLPPVPLPSWGHVGKKGGHILSPRTPVLGLFLVTLGFPLAVQVSTQVDTSPLRMLHTFTPAWRLLTGLVDQSDESSMVKSLAGTLWDLVPARRASAAADCGVVGQRTHARSYSRLLHISARLLSTDRRESKRHLTQRHPLAQSPRGWALPVALLLSCLVLPSGFAIASVVVVPDSAIHTYISL